MDMLKNEQQKVFVVMINDVTEDESIQDCTVWSSKENAKSQLKTVVDSYKNDALAEYIEDDLVGSVEDDYNDKKYVMTESDEHFTFYKNGYYCKNHIEIFILEKVID